MKHLILYNLVNNKTPSNIADGGYFPKGDTLVGLTTQHDTFEQRLTIWELVDYVIDMHTNEPLININDDSVLSDMQVVDMVRSFYFDKVGEITLADIEVLQRKILNNYDKRILRYQDQEALGLDCQDSEITYQGLDDDNQYVGKLALIKYRQDIRNIDIIFNDIENLADIIWPEEPK